MTITYSLDVASSNFFCLYNLLWRWKGSLWKSVYQELVVWLLTYGCLSITYRQYLDKEQREIFEDVTVFFYTYTDFIPITFMLGFYVSTVFTRWWDIFMNIGWIDTPALLISNYIRGADEYSRLLRRTIIRYLVLEQAFVFRDVSAGVKKRFPTLNHLVTAGLMTENELKEYEAIPATCKKYWQIMNWAYALIRLAREQGHIAGEYIYCDLMEKVNTYRGNVCGLTLYDWVPVPLVYTQVVHLAVRIYFLIGLMSRQYITPTRDMPDFPKTADFYIPVMTLIQFVFFVGWMKVAEVILNPLGEDDDDFEVNWILDRNLEVGMKLADEAYGRFPNLEKDVFWGVANPEPLYTADSAARPMNPMVGSTSDLWTEEDGFMLRPLRRRPGRGREGSVWDREAQASRPDLVMPVQRRASSVDDQLPFTQSLMGKSQNHMSAMWRRINNRRNTETLGEVETGSRVGDDRKSSIYSADQGPPPAAAPHLFGQSRRSSISSSVNQFGESFAQPLSVSTAFVDSMKLPRGDTDESLRSPTHLDSANSFTNIHHPRELPSIAEEGEKRRNGSDDGSGSSRSTPQLSKNPSTDQFGQREGSDKKVVFGCDSGGEEEKPKTEEEEEEEEEEEAPVPADWISPSRAASRGRRHKYDSA